MFFTLIHKWLAQIIAEERHSVYANLHLILTAKETPLLTFVEKSCLNASGSLHQQGLSLSFSKMGKEAKIDMTACLKETSNMFKVIFSILMEFSLF